MVPVLECAAVIDIIVVCDSLLYKVGHKYIQLEFHMETLSEPSFLDFKPSSAITCGVVVTTLVFKAGRPGFNTSTQGLKIIEEKGLPLHGH